MEQVCHVLDVRQFSANWLIDDFFPLVEQMTRQAILRTCNAFSGKTMACLFYEPSTRTRASFEIAMVTGRGTVVFTTESAPHFSSVSKGETLEDTIRIISGYGVDVIVLRYHETGGAIRAAAVSSTPIINAGDGTGQHPTQTFLDLYTIYKEKGRLDNLSVAIAGDLKRGRTARSLSYFLGKFPGISLYFVSPKELRMEKDIKDYLRDHNVVFKEYDNFQSVLPRVDVVYQTRIQKERGGDASQTLQLNKENLKLMLENAIILHPLPRVDEITPEVDEDPRAKYFDQATNGLYVRMALLKMILNP